MKGAKDCEVVAAQVCKIVVTEPVSPSAKIGIQERCFSPDTSWASPPQSLLPGAVPEDVEGLSEVEVKEVLAVLENARLVVQRGLQCTALGNLAELGRIEEYSPGIQCGGTSVWTAGWCLVLSGRASVLFQVDGADQEVAMLQKGDSFGLDTFVEDDENLDSWQRFRPRIHVTSAQPLRVCRIHWHEPLSHVASHRGSISLRVSTYRKPKRHPSGKAENPTLAQTIAARELLSITPPSQLGGLSYWLAVLWLSASAPLCGIGSLAGGLLHAQFLASLWAPLLSELEQHKAEIRNRKAKGFRIHDCFPLQGHQIVELRDQVLHLTEIWYGSSRGGNLSSLYKWFMEAMHILGVTAYSFDSIPRDVSTDGWATSIDGQARATALKEKGSVDASYVAAGGAKQRQGRSAIDNTVLRNVFMPQEARELLLGRRLRKALCKFLVIRQLAFLRRLSVHLELDLLWMASEASGYNNHGAVQAVLKSLPHVAIKAAGGDPDSMCYRSLVDRGSVLAGFGQLVPRDQQVVQELARKLLGLGQVQPARSDSPDVFERLVAWCRDRPGEFFEGDKRQHVEVKIAGLLAGKVIIVKRSSMERFSLARYFPINWIRSQPLYGVTGAGPFPVRPADMSEASHVRVNECPYAPLHGMSLSGGGFASDPRVKKRCGRNVGYSLLMELQWVRDPSANVENWFLTDIEKILHESWQLNPHGRRSMILPGEVFINVGQNPKVGSSIRETQHTQLCEGSLASYPFLNLSSKPRHSSALGASVDLVSVGPREATQDQCSFMLKLEADNVVSPKVLEFLVSLRLHLMKQLGGGEAIDFLVYAISNEQGGFMVVFAPIAQLLKVGDEKPDFANWANPLTGESSESCGLQEARVDFGKGLGQFLVSKPALREQILHGGEELLRRIWAFNRVPGAREVVEGYVHGHQLFSNM